MESITERIISDRRNVLISREEIQKRVKELAEQISKDYKGKAPVLICVLNGSFLFFADLVRELTIDCEIDFVKISSYGNALESSGTVNVHKHANCHLEDRDVVVVEDIVDSGRSVVFLKKWLGEMNPTSLKFVSLLVKDETAVVEYTCDYVGFNIPNKFVIGYGLDYAQQLRNLPEIYVMPEDVLEMIDKK